jgi:hypothetical protein
MVGDPSTSPVPTGVTVLEVIVQPHGVHPVELGAVQLTDTLPSLLELALTAVGALGAVPSMTWLDAADAGPVPSALVDVTVKVYAVPTVSPETVALVWPP